MATRHKHVRDRWRAAGLCTSCGKNPGPGYCEPCRDRNKRARQDTEQRAREAGCCLTCGEPSPTYARCDLCRDKANDSRSRLAARKRRQILEAYGGACACCGETHPMFLNIDHINNNGREELRQWSRNAFINKIIREGFPDCYRLLCWNCNAGRHLNGGVCPHQDPSSAARWEDLAADLSVTNGGGPKA